MDVRSSLVSRDSDGIWIVQAGDPAHSLMIERCLLPAEDDDAMPPKGDRLKATELEVLRTWIAAGAVMPATAATTLRPRPPTWYSLTVAAAADEAA